MSEKKSPEDIVACALAHAMLAISYAARLFAEMESQATTQDQTITP